MKQLIGHMDVDAGLCWVGDPCYVIGEDASNAVEKWSDFCAKVKGMNTHAEPLGDGVGFAVSTGYGDGSYPVYIETVDGIGGGERVSSITIEFLKDEEEDEEEDEEDIWGEYSADRINSDEDGELTKA